MEVKFVTYDPSTGTILSRGEALAANVPDMTPAGASYLVVDDSDFYEIYFDTHHVVDGEVVPL
jgi:hypothetical protein